MHSLIGYRHIQVPFLSRHICSRQNHALTWPRETTRLHATKPKTAASEWEVNYTECSDYLKTVGLSNLAELNRVLDIAMNPASLNAKTRNASARVLSVKDDIAPVIDWLTNKGLQVGEVRKVISGHPPVLCYSADKLDKLWSYLESVLAGGSVGVQGVLVERPTLLGLEQENVERIVDYLKYIETPPESIILYLSRSI